MDDNAACKYILMARPTFFFRSKRLMDLNHRLDLTTPLPANSEHGAAWPSTVYVAATAVHAK